MSRSKKSQVEKAIKTIESRYEIGIAVLKRCGERSETGFIAKLAKEYGVPRDTCQKLRAFANTKTGYSKKELNTLFDKFRSEEFALTITHFIKLISIPRGRTRNKLANQAIKNRWSTHRLQAEILSVQGRRQVGGRQPRLATGDDFEHELKRNLWSWERWLVLHLEANLQISHDLKRKTKQLQRYIAQVHAVLDSA